MRNLYYLAILGADFRSKKKPRVFGEARLVVQSEVRRGATQTLEKRPHKKDKNKETNIENGCIENDGLILQP